jgi:hypothetical protein
MPQRSPSIDVGADRAAGGLETSRDDGGAEGEGGPGPLWYELADDHSVLQLRSATASGSSLSLHVVVDADADTTIAWWETENGMWVTEVGAA